MHAKEGIVVLPARGVKESLFLFPILSLNGNAYLISPFSLRICSVAIWAHIGHGEVPNPFPRFGAGPRLFFKYKRQLLGQLCRAVVEALLKYFQASTGAELRPGVVASIQTFGQKVNLHPHIHCLVTEGGGRARSATGMGKRPRTRSGWIIWSSSLASARIF